MDDFIGLTLAPVLEDLNELARKQIPFAKALGITLTANDVKDDLREHARDVFTIRRVWVTNQIRSSRATKRVPRARVYATDAAAFLTQHIEGARKKRPRTAIPRRIRTNPRRVVPRKKFPGAVLRTDPRVFVERLPSGAIGVFRRMGRGNTRRLLWILEREVQVDKTFRAREVAVSTANRVWARNFGRALARAIASAR